MPRHSGSWFGFGCGSLNVQPAHGRGGPSHFFRYCLFFKGAQEGFAVCATKSKSAVSKKAFRTGPLRGKSVKTTGGNLLPYCVRSFPLASAKFAMPLPALLACIVLADFGRSWFADGGSKNLS
jgi:hypothetical protein